MYACLFGTFLYNSEKERQQNEVKKHTQSIWSFVNQNRKLFLNAMYNPDADGKKHVIFPGELIYTGCPINTSMTQGVLHI